MFNVSIEREKFGSIKTTSHNFNTFEDAINFARSQNEDGVTWYIYRDNSLPELATNRYTQNEFAVKVFIDKYQADYISYMDRDIRQYCKLREYDDVLFAVVPVGYDNSYLDNIGDYDSYHIEESNRLYVLNNMPYQGEFEEFNGYLGIPIIDEFGVHLNNYEFAVSVIEDLSGYPILDEDKYYELENQTFQNSITSIHEEREFIRAYEVLEGYKKGLGTEFEYEVSKALSDQIAYSGSYYLSSDVIEDIFIKIASSHTHNFPVMAQYKAFYDAGVYTLTITLGYLMPEYDLNSENTAKFIEVREKTVQFYEPPNFTVFNIETIFGEYVKYYKSAFDKSTRKELSNKEYR